MSLFMCISFTMSAWPNRTVITCAEKTKPNEWFTTYHRSRKRVLALKLQIFSADSTSRPIGRVSCPPCSVLRAPLMTLEWGDVSREVMAVYAWSWPIFVSFVMITSFIAYNLIVAVVCDSVSMIEKQSKEDMAADDESEGGLTTEELHFQQIHRLQVRVAELSKQQQQVLQALLDAGAPEFGAPYFRTSEIK